MATILQAIDSAQNNQDPHKRTLPSIPMQTAPRQSGFVNVKPNVCQQCNGIQYFRLDVEIGHPSFGRLVPCPSCMKSEKASGLNEMERGICFTDIETAGRPGAAAMLNAAREFIEAGRCGFMTIYGGYGNGKTTLLQALVNDCIEAQVDVYYITMTEVMAYAREAFDSEQRGESDYGRIAQLASTQVLVIDELDKARVSDYVREVQTHLFNVRYRKSHLLGTIVAWNGGFESFELPWVRSRLSEYIVVQNNDADMRPLLRRKS